MSASDRPKPEATEYSAPFWEGCERRELRVQRCTSCETLRHYPQPLCPECQSDGFDWAVLTGRGEIYSFTVARRAFHPAWKEHVPYVLATIELEEGVRMVCDLLDIDPDSVEIGQQVEVDFAEMPGQGVMPRFRVVS